MHKSKIKPILYSILSFFLTLILFLLSICIVLKTTIFSKDYMYDTMNSCGYYTMIKTELTDELQNLGNASGFDKEFSASFVNSLDIQSAVQNYIASFYSGASTLVDTTLFKQNLYTAIDHYISEKNYDKSKTSGENIDYFVNSATDIYVNQISIPFFSVVANYIYKAQPLVNGLIIGLSIATLIIAAIIFLTNKYRHRRFRYLCYGLIGAGITTAVIPCFVLLSGKIPQININTRSLYNLFVSYFNGLFASFWIYVVIILVLAMLTLFLYMKYYKGAVSEHSN